MQYIIQKEILMISWVYLILVVGILGGLVHYFVNLVGGLAGGIANVVARGNLIKEPRFPNIGLFVAFMSFAILVVYGIWDIFNHFYIIQPR